MYLFIAAVAVTHRHPFDQPEAEQDTKAAAKNPVKAVEAKK